MLVKEFAHKTVASVAETHYSHLRLHNLWHRLFHCS